MTAAAADLLGSDPVAPHAGPTSDPAWADACIDVFGLEDSTIEVENARARLVLARDRLEFAGAKQLFEPMDLQWDGESALVELAAVIGATGRPLWLLRVPSRSPAIAALRAHMPFVVERPAAACPVLHLDADVDRMLSARRRQDLRRARRRAEAFGITTAEVVAPDAAEVDRLVDRAFAVEASGWKGRTGSALLLDRRRAAFYRAYAHAAAAAGALRIAFLVVAGVPAAMQLAVERDGALWLLKIGYDDRFASCSPGHLLLEHTLRWAAERGLERFEFLGTAAPWTRLWTSDEWRCCTVLAYPANVRGAVAAVRDGRKHVLRRVRR